MSSPKAICAMLSSLCIRHPYFTLSSSPLKPLVHCNANCAGMMHGRFSFLLPGAKHGCASKYYFWFSKFINLLWNFKATTTEHPEMSCGLNVLFNCPLYGVDPYYITGDGGLTYNSMQKCINDWSLYGLLLSYVFMWIRNPRWQPPQDIF